MTQDEQISSVSDTTESAPVTELEPAISVRDLSKSFGAQGVLAGVSFDIADGEMLVVLGPSGSGKTTHLRIIAALEQCDSGEVFLKGRRAT